MKPLKVYKVADGTTRQYREGEQPKGAVEVKLSAAQTPEERAAKAPAKRTRKKPAQGTSGE